MLNQLARLSVESDGRYATAAELQFVKDYMASADQRISAYEKIRDAEYQIIYEVTAQVRSRHPNIFMKGEHDMTSECQRDCGHMLKCTAAAMVIDDLDRLRDSLLLWQQTIINALKLNEVSQAMWKALPDVINRYLSPEEAAIMLPVLRLNQALLG